MTLARLNTLPPGSLSDLLHTCCGSSAWVTKVLRSFPVDSKTALQETATSAWYDCRRDDWLEAFSHHPKIGELDVLREKISPTATWAKGEQAAVGDATEETLIRLTNANKAYEEKFHYIFIICATGKTAPEMLSLLNQRLTNKPEDEIHIAMTEQMKITLLRIDKLLTP